MFLVSECADANHMKKLTIIGTRALSKPVQDKQVDMLFVTKQNSSRAVRKNEIAAL